MPDEVWEGDEYGDDPEAPPPPAPAEVAHQGRRTALPLLNRPRGIPREFASDARREALAAATGRDGADPSWREDLRTGNRSAAVSRLASRAPTHHSASGFGLAQEAAREERRRRQEGST